MKMYEEEDNDDDDDVQNGDSSSLKGGPRIFNFSLTNINLNHISRSSPYRAVNTLHLRYTNQSVNVL